MSYDPEKQLGSEPYEVMDEGFGAIAIPFVIAALLIAGAVMVCCGAMRGEVESVLSKAIRLCLECIGIG